MYHTLKESLQKNADVYVILVFTGILLGVIVYVKTGLNIILPFLFMLLNNLIFVYIINKIVYWISKDGYGLSYTSFTRLYAVIYLIRLFFIVKILFI